VLTKCQIASVAQTFALGSVDGLPQRMQGGVANPSFTASANNADFVITRLDNHDEESAERLARTTDWVRSAGIPVPTFLRTSAGAAVVEVDGYLFCVKRFEPGSVSDSLTPQQLQSVGEALRQLHARQPPDSIAPIETRRLPVDFKNEADSADPGYGEWLDAVARQTEPERLAPDKRALIHGDLFPDNVVADGRSIALLDWETACLDNPLLDVGMTIVGLCSHNGKLLPERAAAFLIAYYGDGPGTKSVAMWKCRDAARYCACVIGFHRLIRHRVRHPNRSKWEFHREMVALEGSITRDWNLVA